MAESQEQKMNISLDGWAVPRFDIEIANSAIDVPRAFDFTSTRVSPTAKGQQFYTFRVAASGIEFKSTGFNDIVIPEDVYPEGSRPESPLESSVQITLNNPILTRTGITLVELQNIYRALGKIDFTVADESRMRPILSSYGITVADLHIISNSLNSQRITHDNLMNLSASLSGDMSEYRTLSGDDEFWARRGSSVDLGEDLDGNDRDVFVVEVNAANEIQVIGNGTLRLVSGSAGDLISTAHNAEVLRIVDNTGQTMSEHFLGDLQSCVKINAGTGQIIASSSSPTGVQALR
ncbi:MAG: hypothetical protein ACOYJ2_08755 [Rickettsiales bacterium]